MKKMQRQPKEGEKITVEQSESKRKMKKETETTQIGKRKERKKSKAVTKAVTRQNGMLLRRKKKEK